MFSPAARTTEILPAAFLLSQNPRWPTTWSILSAAAWPLRPPPTRRRAPPPPPPQTSFASQWGIGCLMDNVQQWKDVVQDVLTALVVLYVLDKIRFTDDRVWFERLLDNMSGARPEGHGMPGNNHGGKRVCWLFLS